MPKTGHLWCQPHRHRSGNADRITAAALAVAAVCVLVYIADLIVQHYLWTVIVTGVVIVALTCVIAWGSRVISRRMCKSLDALLPVDEDTAPMAQYTDAEDRLEQIEGALRHLGRSLDEVREIAQASMAVWSDKQLERLRDSDDLPNT
jgi:hypothetical protein